jgi:hypothetical protein
MSVASSQFVGPALVWYHQVNPYWCVAACGQMVLEYHGITQLQPDLATALGLYNSRGKPKALPNEASAVAKVATHLTSKSQQAQTCPTKDIESQSVQSPSWAVFKQRVRQGPLVGFIPAHAWVVAGFWSETYGGVESAREFRVYDPDDGEKWVSADIPQAQFLCSAKCETHVY